MSKDEIWRDVHGYEGLYKVSNKGNVRSVDRINHIGRKYSGRTRNLVRGKNGYLQVILYKNGVRKNKLIHRLVAQVFLPNPNNYPEVNHRDEVKDNNNVENLEWCTSKHNANHGTRNERLSKKVRAVNVETGKVITFKSTQEAGRKGYDQGGVAKASNGVYKDSSTGKLIGDGHTYKDHRWSYI